MTVPATARRAGPYNGNGSTTSFSFSFKTFAAGDLQVTRTSSVGIETVLVLNSDYSVTLNPDQDTSPGGTITYPISGSPLSAGSKLTIVGNLAYEQTTDLLGGGAFNARVIEDTFDRTVIQIQQLEERADRALALPVSASGVSATLPVPAADKVIAWNSTANELINRDIADFATTLAYSNWRSDRFSGNGSTTVFTLTSDPGNVNNMDVSIGGVTQVNGVDFTVSSTTLTFTSAPPAGTNNILARYGQALPVGTSNASQVTFNPAGTGNTRTSENKLREVVSVKDFGAVGDGSTDDTAAVQAALNYIASNGGTLLINGVCLISSTLTISSGSYKWIIAGGGGWDKGAIKASAAMNFMLEVNGTLPAYPGEVQIRDLTLIGNNLAGGINTFTTVYSTFERLRFIQIANTKTCLKMGNWGNRVSNCIFAGGDKSVELVSPTTEQLNGLVFERNVFNDANYGIYQSGLDYANGVTVRDNIFDNCAKAGIYWYGYTYNLTICGNYFEACGGTANSVEISAGVFANRYGALVFAKNYLVGTAYSGLNVYDNLFLTCTQAAPVGSRACISLENATSVHVYDNNVYPSGTYDAFISLDGEGVIFTTGIRVRLEHCDEQQMFSQMVRNNVSTGTGYGNFNASFSKTASLLRYELPNIWENIASLTLSGLLTATQSYVNGINQIQFNRTGGGELTFDTTDLNLLKFFINKYLRVNGQAFPAAGSNGLRVIVEIDTGAGLVTAVDSSFAATVAARITQGEVFFVPSTATRLRIRVFPVSNGIVDVYNLRLVDTAEATV